MGYDAWKTGNWGDDYWGEPDYQCKTCRENEQKLDEISDLVLDISLMLHGKKKFCKAALSVALADLCWLTNVAQQEGFVKVFSAENKENKIFNFASEIAKSLHSGNVYTQNTI